MNLLIADDESIIRKGLSSIPWNEYGITLLSPACDGLSAKVTIETETVDILLTDIRMPGLDGLELAAKLLERNPNARIIILSGYAEFEYAHRAIGLGAVSYLLKPARISDIIGAVQKAMRAIQSQPETASQLQPIPDSIVQAGCRPVLSFILQNYEQPMTLPALAQQFHFSPSHLSRSIKKATGYSFIQFLTAVRIYHAALALRSSNLRISEISANVGIPNEQYFSQLFKNNYGVSPNVYRKRQKPEKPSPIILFLEKLPSDL